MDKIEENSELIEKNSIEKPKKKREATEKQKEHLKTIREKKKVISKAKQLLIEKEKVKELEPKNNFQGANGPPNYSELLKISKDVEEIKKYIDEKKLLKEQKAKKDNSIDKTTIDEEEQKLKELLYKKQLYSNFLRNPN